MMIFIRSQTNRMASRISASVAVTIRSTWREITAKVRGPSEVRRPSAIVWGSFEGWIEPASSDRRASSALAGSAPMTRVVASRPLTARAVPESRPPPPTGQIDHVERPGLVEQLQRGGPLAGDHVPVVEGMDQREAVLRDLGGDRRLAGGERRLAGDDPRAVALGRRPLDRGRGPRHHDA